MTGPTEEELERIRPILEQATRELMELEQDGDEAEFMDDMHRLQLVLDLTEAGWPQWLAMIASKIFPRGWLPTVMVKEDNGK